jgi:Helix-turn-helix domain
VYGDHAADRARRGRSAGIRFASCVGISMVSDDNMPHLAWCIHLRRERERRRIALESISSNTKISASLFEALERGDVSRWPSGIFRRSFIRAYASAIGLEADTIAREFLEKFPDPLEPPAPTPAVPAPAAGIPAAAAAPPPASEPALRLKLADTPTSFVHGRLLTDMRARLAAIACDGGLVVAIAVGLFLVFHQFWLPLAVVMLAYYLGGILVLGNTPGVCLVAPEDRSAHYNRPADDVTRERPAAPAHPAWHFRMPAR